MKFKYVAIIFVFLFNLSLLKAQKASAARDTYEWNKYYSEKSIVKKEAIDFRMLQGIWFAYEGHYFGDDERIWKDYNNPRILEIKGNLYRTGYGIFRTYKEDRKMICPKCGLEMYPLPWQQGREMLYEETWQCRS